MRNINRERTEKMSMAQEVFQRIEKKYLLTPQQHEKLMQAIDGHMCADAFGEHTICNLYLDTPDYDLTRMSIEKPVYKEKMRLRSYGVPKENDEVFLEIKKKYKGVVYKRRIELTQKEAMEYLLKGARPQKDSQILHEIDYFLKYHNPQPRVYLCYDRTAYFSPENPDLRITMDHDIRFRLTQVDLSKGAWGTSVLPQNTKLMEIKIPGVMPLWLADALDENGIYPQSYSKIGTVYSKFIQPTLHLGGNEICYQVS